MVNLFEVCKEYWNKFKKKVHLVGSHYANSQLSLFCFRNVQTVLSCISLVNSVHTKQLKCKRVRDVIKLAHVKLWLQ